MIDFYVLILSVLLCGGYLSILARLGLARFVTSSPAFLLLLVA